MHGIIRVRLAPAEEQKKYRRSLKNKREVIIVEEGEGEEKYQGEGGEEKYQGEGGEKKEKAKKGGNKQTPRIDKGKMRVSISLSVFFLGLLAVCCNAETFEHEMADVEDTITIGKMRYTKADWEARKDPIESMKAIREEKYRWPNATVPFLRDDYSNSEWLIIRGAMDEWQKYTCIKFKHLDDEKNYIWISRYSGCSAFVGMRGWGEQPVKAYSCITHNSLTELFGMTVGFETESLRPDRDDYLDVLWDNVYTEDKIYLEALSTWQVDTMEVPYDYRSITSYHEHAFSKGSRYISLKAKDDRYQDIMGQPLGLSFQDIHLATKMYKCNEHCPDMECPYGGFVGKDCKCWCDSEKPYDKICECGTPGCMGSTTHPKCRDLREECQMWADDRECEYRKSYMLYKCPRACGLCGENPSCMDFHDDCEYYKNRGYCTTENRETKDWTYRHCRFTCNYC